MTEDIHWRRFRISIYVTTASAIAVFLTVFTLNHGWDAENPQQRLQVHNTASWAAATAIFATMAVFAYVFARDQERCSWLVAPATLSALAVLCWIVGFHNLATNQIYASWNQAAILAGAISSQSVAAILTKEITRAFCFSRFKVVSLLLIEIFLIGGSLTLPIIHILFAPLIS